MADADQPVPHGPLPIRRLQESLINKIAAGEIIHRPASALKELIENSLDARSTSIKITVKDGGLKLLQIQDNGCGIRKADLTILAERFTTSKISKFSDLSQIATYGFRGEALASISHVAQLSVVTKTKNEPCAWKGHYNDGALVPPKPGQSSEAKPCAGNDGTLITIENLFYNTPTRLSVLRSSSEEYAKILEVIVRYAVHNPHVAFVCKKAGSTTPDVSTPSGSDTVQVIKLLYGNTIAKELLHATPSKKKRKRVVSRKRKPDEDEDENAMAVDDDPKDRSADGAGEESDPESWSAEAHFTSPNYQGKKMTFLLFINHRLVESPRLKKALEAVYNSVLPKGSSPFVYLSLQINPRSLDVNVHPTKQTVHFLNEDSIIEAVADSIQLTLSGGNAGGATGDITATDASGAGRSRAFVVQTLLTGSLSRQNSKKQDLSKTRSAKGKEVELIDLEKDRDGEDEDDDNDELDELEPSPSTKPIQAKKKVYSQHKVRTSLQDRTLDSMFPIANPATVPGPAETAQSASAAGAAMTQAGVAPSQSQRSTNQIKETECFLHSVVSLRREVEKSVHHQLSEIIANHTFVGIVDLDRSLSLIQHSTRLYLVNHAALAEELFYQLGLRQFGNFSRIKLEPPPPLRTLIKIAVGAEDESRIECIGLGKSGVVDAIVEIITKNRPLLSEYFNLNISDDGLVVESLPMLLRGYTPNLDKLPGFLMRLGPQVTWSVEKECFHSFLRELAYFYVPGPGPGSEEDPSSVSLPDSAKTTGQQQQPTRANEAESAERWQIKHVLFPCMRKYLVPIEALLDKDVVEVASLPDLYRVFERC